MIRSAGKATSSATASATKAAGRVTADLANHPAILFIASTSVRHVHGRGAAARARDPAFKARTTSRCCDQELSTCFFSAANSSSVKTPESCSPARRSSSSTRLAGAGCAARAGAPLARLAHPRGHPRRHLARRSRGDGVGELADHLAAQELEAERDEEDQQQRGTEPVRRLGGVPPEDHQQQDGERAVGDQRLAEVGRDLAPQRVAHELGPASQAARMMTIP